MEDKKNVVILDSLMEEKAKQMLKEVARMLGFKDPRFTIGGNDVVRFFEHGNKELAVYIAFEDASGLCGFIWWKAVNAIDALVKMTMHTKIIVPASCYKTITCPSLEELAIRVDME